MTAGHGVTREGAATRDRAGNIRVVMSGVLTRIGILVRRDVASEVPGGMTAVLVPEAVSVMTVGAATAPDLVLRGLLSVGRSGTATIVLLVLRAPLSAGPSGIAMIGVPGALIVGRVLRVVPVSVVRTGVATIGGLVVRAVTALIGVLVARVATVGLRSVRGTIVGVPPVASAVRSGIGMIVGLVARAPLVVSVGRSGTGMTVGL
ncbi:hypothetical protein LDL08_45615, partial [Nonomuraea glycinis]|uniref:hypothetical protein n=1 Tax=Nonomuraea glycinis TaxID=2047744 RepID=UPI001CD9A242